MTEAGAWQTPDPRCNSYKAALNLCLEHQLAGIVTDVRSLLYCPKEIVDLFHHHGLLIVSYGGGNNIPENVKAQKLCGMDAVIVDEVKLMRKTLDSLH